MASSCDGKGAAGSSEGTSGVWARLTIEIARTLKGFDARGFHLLGMGLCRPDAWSGAA
jgi:hypothetical protein